MRYDFGKIEKKWQDRWDEAGIFKATDDYSKPKFYGLVEFPYPSGAGMHVGHIKAYSGLEVVSRKRRMQGYNVLFPMGYDAFGLPTENYAIKNHIHPAKVTHDNIENFSSQLHMLGVVTLVVIGERLNGVFGNADAVNGCLLAAAERTGGK